MKILGVHLDGAFAEYAVLPAVCAWKLDPGISSEIGATLEPIHARIESARPQDPPYLRRMIAGRFFESVAEPTVVVSEFLLYRWGLIDDAAVDKAIVAFQEVGNRLKPA